MDTTQRGLCSLDRFVPCSSQESQGRVISPTGFLSSGATLASSLPKRLFWVVPPPASPTPGLETASLRHYPEPFVSASSCTGGSACPCYQCALLSICIDISTGVWMLVLQATRSPFFITRSAAPQDPCSAYSPLSFIYRVYPAFPPCVYPWAAS